MRARRGGGGALRGVTIGVRPAASATKKKGGPKKEWDSTFHDLDEMKLSPQQLEARMRERVSKNLIRGPGRGNPQPSAAGDYLEDDSDMSHVIEGLNAKRWQLDANDRRVQEAAESYGVDYSSISQDLAGRPARGRSPRPKSSRLELPAWGSRAAGSSKNPTPVKSQPASASSPAGDKQHARGRPLAWALEATLNPGSHEGGAQAEEEAALPPSSGGVVDFDAELRSFQDRRAADSYNSRIAVLQKREPGTLPPGVARVATTDEESSEAAGGAGEPHWAAADADSAGDTAGTGEYSEGQYTRDDDEEEGGRGGLSTEEGSGRETDGYYQTTEWSGAAGGTSCGEEDSGTPSRTGTATATATDEGGEESFEGEEADSESAPEGVPVHVTPEKGRWPHGGPRAEARAAEAAAKVVAEERASFLRVEMHLRDEVAGLREELLRCRDEQREARAEMEEYRAHTSSVISSLQGQLTRMFTGTTPAGAPAAAAAVAAAAAPPPNPAAAAEQAAAGAPSIRQAPAWLDRVESQAASSMDMRARVAAPATAPPHAPFPPLPAARPGRALADPAAAAATAGWPSPYEDARRPVADLDDELNLPSFASAAASAAPDAPRFPPGAPAPREAWGPDAGAYVCVPTALAGQAAAHAYRGAEVRRAGGVPKQPFVHSNPGLEEEPRAQKAPAPHEGHPVRELLASVPTFKLASTHMPPTSALFHTSNRPSLAPPAVPRYSLPGDQVGAVKQRRGLTGDEPFPVNEDASLSLRAHAPPVVA